MAINSFKDVQDFINQFLNANGDMPDVPTSPHKDFWNSLTYTQFTQGNIPGVTDNKNNPVRILIPHNSAMSTLIQVLNGTSTVFDQMPADGPPFFDKTQVKELADWIDAGCQE
ncbi:hypothetical protein UP09_04965 [Bradyrhizobium sp. LTSP885]|nr:hypothetical protein UP09_04965 [Bradyrhizobium sp. LTSP885]